MWVKGQTSSSENVSLSLLVQPVDFVTKNWTGPKMTPEKMKDHNTRMVACWNTGSGNQHAKHAVYVKNWTKAETENSYNFDCINSWGQVEENPQLTEKDFSEKYYISITKGNLLKQMSLAIVDKDLPMERSKAIVDKD